MASWDDVRRIAMGMPDAVEKDLHGWMSWRVRDKLFVWERPLIKSELAALGDDAPDGPILGVRVEHFGAKEALLADDPGVFFTTPHFDRSATVLVRLEEIAADELQEVIVDAWLARAPKRIAERYLQDHGLDI